MKTTRSGERTRELVLMAYNHTLVIIIEDSDIEDAGNSCVTLNRVNPVQIKSNITGASQKPITTCYERISGQTEPSLSIWTAIGHTFPGASLAVHGPSKTSTVWCTPAMDT